MAAGNADCAGGAVPTTNDSAEALTLRGGKQVAEHGGVGEVVVASERVGGFPRDPCDECGQHGRAAVANTARR